MISCAVSVLVVSVCGLLFFQLEGYRSIGASVLMLSAFPAGDGAAVGGRHRAVAIAVLLATSIALALSFRGTVRNWYRPDHKTAVPATIAFVMSGVLMAVPHFKLDEPVLLMAERFLPGAGSLQILIFSSYAAFLAATLLKASSTSAIRITVWRMFSIVFFAQFALGLLGFDRFLMTGKLHLPIPALIIAGPFYRGHGFFMPVLYCATILIGGAFWCSWLCYIGSWDSTAAKARARPGNPVRGRERIRILLLVMIIAAALGMRLAGFSVDRAVYAAVGFGLVGVGIMVFLSRKRGTMVHCTTFCPIGLISVTLGKINPFRVRISGGCTGCSKCRHSCRYAALEPHHIRERKVGYTCTLCGDCVSSCPSGEIRYRFPFLKPQTARTAFLVTAVVVHTVFLAFARI